MSQWPVPAKAPEIEQVASAVSAGHSFAVSPLSSAPLWFLSE